MKLDRRLLEGMMMKRRKMAIGLYSLAAKTVGGGQVSHLTLFWFVGVDVSFSFSVSIMVQLYLYKSNK